MSSALQISLHDRIDAVSRAEWDGCAGPGNPFVGHAFLSALEDSGSVGGDSGWQPCHLAMRDKAGILQAAVPLYVKAHSYGEYVFDHGWAEAFERAGGHYYPKLQACVPFTPVPGPRLLRRPGAAVEDISEGLRQACAALETSSVHVTFCTEAEWAALGKDGWLRRIGVQYHWQNDGYGKFDDFLAALSANHRKSIRRERRDAQACGLTFETLRGDDIKPHHWDAFDRFYRATSDRKWGSPYLTRDFFDRLGATMGDSPVLMLAAQDGTYVAGALNLVGGDTLYGRNWGCVGQWPFLHFELCYYRAIDFAIEHGLMRVEAGAQGEHKIQRGYRPQPTYSAHWIAHAGLRDAVGAFLKRERTAIQGEIAGLAHDLPFKKG